MSTIGEHLKEEIWKGLRVLPVVHSSAQMGVCDMCVFTGSSCTNIPCTDIERDDRNNVYFIKPDPVDTYKAAKATETDPSGKSAHTAGAKLDAGKIEPSLILDGMPRALMEVAKVATYGKNKYSKHGWLAVDDGISRYTAAMDRHRLKEMIEGTFDQDSKLADGVDIRHAAQVAWNALARLELILRTEEGDMSI